MDDPTLVHVDGLTDIGTRRTNNEDAWWAGRPGGEHQQMMPGPAALQLDAAEGPVLLLVSDGVGGANAGEVASQMAVTLVAAVLAKEPAPLRSQATAGAALLLVTHRERAELYVEQFASMGLTTTCEPDA